MAAPGREVAAGRESTEAEAPIGIAVAGDDRGGGEEVVGVFRYSGVLGFGD